jgi:predicted Ser/Thr protein kinase
VTTPLRPGDPRQLGGYQLLGRLGEGGMGTVYLARGFGGRLVAIKVIRPEYSFEDEFRARFRSEVSRARQVPPFCTAEVLDADPEHQTPYLVVEYVDGPSLAEVVQVQGPLAAGNLHSVAIGVATALTAIHGAGVIHRDLKPRNVLFSLGTPKVIDFGIARALEVTSQHTRTDQMVGTVAYMAPERFDTGASRSVSPAADVFAWGAVVGYAGTGRTPFQADSAAATAARILTQPPDLSGLPEPLRGLVALTLRKDPADRPTAHELLDMLLAAGPAGGALLQAATAAKQSRRYHTGDTETPVLAPRPRRRYRWAWALGILAALVAIPAAVYALGGPDGNEATPAAASASPAPPPRVAAPAARKSGAPAAVRGQAVIDKLDRPGQWTDDQDAGGACRFAKRLVAITEDSSIHQCVGPKDSFAGDQTIAVDVALNRAGSCGEIWFRYVERSGYRLSVCPDALKLELDDDDTVTTLSSVASTAFPIGQQAHRVQIDIRKDVATASVDGTVLLKAATDDPSLAAGQVILGAQILGGDPPATASFANIAIRPSSVPTSSGGPAAYTDVTKGDSTSMAKLLSYNQAGQSAIVEPVLFYFGPDYCKAYHVPASDGRCNREWITVDSHQKVTVPMSSKAKLLYLREGDPDCVDADTGSGSCALAPKAFASWLKDNSEALVRLTVKAGAATSIAEFYTP